MMTEEKHVHIHLPALTPGTHVHIHVSAADEDPRSETSEDAEVRAMLKRLTDYANAKNVKALYEGLLQIGYTPHVPSVRKEGKAQEAYLRWTDPAQPRPATLYFDTASADFARKGDREVLGGLPGAQITDRLVRFAIGTAAGVEQALIAAKTVKG
jgi:hypothetical protein